MIFVSITYRTDYVLALTPKIVVTPTPHGINTDGRTHELLTIELQTSDDKAFLAPQDIRIHISSSNLNVGDVEEFVIIPEGMSFTKAEFTSSHNSGVTIITASSPGFQTGDTRLQIFQSNFDSRLIVYVSPNTMPAIPDIEGMVTIQIVNRDGEPYPAIENIDIKLTSSNHSVCTVTEDITIYQGENYAMLHQPPDHPYPVGHNHGFLQIYSDNFHNSKSHTPAFHDLAPDHISVAIR